MLKDGGFGVLDRLSRRETSLSTLKRKQQTMIKGYVYTLYKAPRERILGVYLRKRQTKASSLCLIRSTDIGWCMGGLDIDDSLRETVSR